MASNDEVGREHNLSHSPSSIAIPRCTSSGCLEWTRAHDNRIMVSLLSSSESPSAASATSLSQPWHQKNSDSQNTKLWKSEITYKFIACKNLKVHQYFLNSKADIKAKTWEKMKHTHTHITHREKAFPPPFRFLLKLFAFLMLNVAVT
jgi:hypothetical protein